MLALVRAKLPEVAQAIAPLMGAVCALQVLEHIADLAARSVEESKIREKAVAEILRKEGWWVVCA